MSIRFGKMLMNSGEDYQLTQNITLHHPSIEEILSIDKMIGEDIYWKYVQTLMCDPYSNMVMLDDIGKDFMTTTPFEVFILQWKNYENDYKENKDFYDKCGFKPIDIVLKALNFFIVENHDFTYGITENNEEVIYDKNMTNCRISKDIFDYLYEWLKTINKVDYSNRIQPADENARRVLIEDTRDEIKKAKKRKKKDKDDIDYIGNLMSAVTYGGNGVITPFNINQCKIYWLFESCNIDAKKSHSNHILDGLYHGTISRDDINQKELDWIN